MKVISMIDYIKFKRTNSKVYFKKGCCYEMYIENDLYHVIYNETKYTIYYIAFDKQSFMIYFETLLKYKRRMKLSRLETLNN